MDIKPFKIPAKWKYIELFNKTEPLTQYKVFITTFKNNVILFFFDSSYKYIFGGSDINKMLIPKSGDTLYITDDYLFDIQTYQRGYLINKFLTSVEYPLEEEIEIISELMERFKFKGELYLNDKEDVVFNLLKGIDNKYCKYGFKYTEESLKKLEKIKDRLLSFQEYLKNKDWNGDKNDKIFQNYFIKSDFDNLQELMMVKNLSQEIIEENCNFTLKSEKVYEEDIYSLPMSLEIEDIILQPEKSTDKEILEEYFQLVDQYIKNSDINLLSLYLVDKLFPLEINFSILDISQRKEIIRLVNKVIQIYGFMITSKPLEFVENGRKMIWIKKGSEHYIIIGKLLGFLILSGMYKIAYEFLKALLKLHKENKESITLEDFKKWNCILG